MLDVPHADLPKPSNDHNIYALGSIGKHSVVMACLPKGKFGNALATTIAATSNVSGCWGGLRLS